MTIRRMKTKEMVYVDHYVVHHMTVGGLREFLRQLDEAEAPDSAAVDEHRNHDTLHWTGVSARWEKPDGATPQER